MGLFISYSSQDRSAIEPLTTALRRARQQVWFDDDLGGGEAWWNEILEQIRSCEVFIVALSNHSLESKPCQAELRYAKALERPILPVRIGPVDSMRANPLAALQVIDYQNPSVDAGIQLVTAVHGLAAQQRPLPSPLPDEPPVPFAYLMRLSSTLAEQDLDPRQQTHLVTELKSGLEEDGDDPTARNDIGRLLRMLRDRSDVTYRTRTEIDELLASVDAKSATAAVSSAQPDQPAGSAVGSTPPPRTGTAEHLADVSTGRNTSDDGGASRRRLLIAGGVGLAVVVAIAVVVVLVTQRPHPTPSAKPTTPAAAPSAGAPSAAAPTPSVGLNSILLNPTEINTVMGASNIQPKKQAEQMDVPSVTSSNPDCLGALAPIQDSAYQGSGYTAVRGQTLDAQDPARFVSEAAVSFPSAEQALGFVKTSADKWQACVGQLVTVTTPDKILHWNFANLAGAPPKITQVHTQLHGGRTCQRALSAVSNIVIDVVACGERIADEGSRIADQMAAKVTP